MRLYTSVRVGRLQTKIHSGLSAWKRSLILPWLAAILAGGSTASPTVSGSPSSPPSACAPSLPKVTWVSPYAGWSRGLSANANYFPIAVWLQGAWHAREMSQLGINIYVANNAGTDPLASADLATLNNQGIQAILGQDSVGLANINDPTIVGWWMSPDEPDNAQPNALGGYGRAVDPTAIARKYASYKIADPTRPIYLGLGQGVAYDGWWGRGNNPPPESGYVPSSDIVGFDIYPYNKCGTEPAICGQFWRNAFGIDRLRQWSTHNQAVWTWIETTNMNGTGGPTPAQMESEVWLSLIHGANGIGYFIDTWYPSFREDGIFNDPAMVAAVARLNQEIKSLAPELNIVNIPNLVNVTSADRSVAVDTMVKANGSSIYVFSVLSTNGTTTASYSIQGMSGDADAAVVSEDRTVKVVSGKFSDKFSPNGVHIYKIDFASVTCR
jgi:hypothetical protein